ncbi:TPM domain-containing protein [Sphingomonas sp. ac-8]|uniref:TPM domain-containing protein n=1 Tax=Sphingomonas sp. ac-8 TaxID=3242977 RepID=UPI003A7F7B03
MRLVRLLLATLLALAPAAGARAQDFPKFTGFVVDAANVLPPEQEAALTQKLDRLQQQTNHQLVVATVPDLQGIPIEDYGYRLGRAWAVGLKDADNGAILLVAPNDRKVRVEVGYGLEPVLTDAFSSTVVNGTILPRFKAGDLPGGIVAGVDALAEQLSLPDADAQARAEAAAAEYDRTHRSTAKTGGGGIPFALVFWGMVLLFVLLSLVRGRGAGGGGKRGRRYRSRRSGGSDWPIVLWTIANAIDHGSRDDDDHGGWGGWGGGGGSSGGGGGWGGGGFGGGGGGSFGGGGASGSW